MVENNSTKFRCNICNKNYKDKSGLWYHNNKCHGNNNSKILQKPPKNETTTPETSNTTQSVLSTTNLNNLSCNYCNKTFSRIDNLNRHINFRCKAKINKDSLLNENNKLKLIIEKQSEEIKEVKSILSEEMKEVKSILTDLLNKNCKVHPKTLQKINKQLNGDHNTINETINNGTVNNTYNIIALGHENLTDVFSRKEKMAILKYRYCSLPHLVEYTHFNDKYPQFKNILITNTQNTLAYKFDNKKKKFITVNKNDLLDDIIDERMCDLSSFYDELENDLDEKTKEIIEIVKEKIDSDPAYKELKKKDIKLIIYNNRKKVNKDITNEIELEV
jgi:hypothetical protein